ncbi:MAG: hypothetical protein M0R17_06910 [Candidatus Omnitrophica bacterium]|jgi:hypothetical protein|nr:hypothetical protein [Candidatus Omnitrophota bacterium]
MRYTSGKYGAALKKDWGGALTGASSGAQMGAGLGTMFGPVGSIVGGAIGAIGGALFGNRKENKLRRQQKAQDAAIAKLKEEEKVRTENLRLKQLNLNDTAYLSNFKLNEQSSLFMKNGGWIQKANASIKRRGTEGVCSGSNFGGPSCRPGTKRYALAKTFKKMAKNKEDGGTVEEKSINIKDKRTIDAVTGKLVNSKNRFHAKVDSDYVKQVVSSAKKHGVDPSTALAINMAETRFNPEHNTNPFMLNYYDPYGNIIDESMRFIASKQKHAKRLGKTTDADIIQAYNGYGTIKNKGKLYGINTDSTEINMSKTPLYGKRVVNLRDSVLHRNPEIMNIIKNTKSNGGKLATTGINLKGGNKLITNRNGGTSGTHESGQNIPIKKNGKTLAIAEPGEVLVNDKDIYDVPFVLSKKLGFAQDFMELESIKNVYNKDIIEDKQNKLVVMNNKLTSKSKRAANGIAISPILSKAAPSKFKLQGTNNPYKPSMSKRSGSLLGDLKTNFTGFDANTVFGAVGTLGNMIMSNKAIKRQKGLIQNSLTEALNYNPILNKNYLLNDVVDINDQISETNQNYNSSVSGLSGIDPAIAGAIKSSASLNKSRSVGAILANRRNMQAGIRNQNTMNIAQNNASNNAVLNETALMKLNAKIAANEQLGEAENARLSNMQGAISEFNTILRDKDIMKSLDARWKDSIGQDYTGKKLKCGGKVGKRRKHSMAY